MLVGLERTKEEFVRFVQRPRTKEGPQDECSLLKTPAPLAPPRAFRFHIDRFRDKALQSQIVSLQPGSGFGLRLRVKGESSSVLDEAFLRQNLRTHCKTIWSPGSH